MREHRAAGARRPAQGRYVALLDYLPTDRGRVATVRRLRHYIRSATGVATTHGFGPRYLHSTGQYHKGGPNTGLFLLLTAPDATTTAVPGNDYSFSVLKQAQALGDFEALVAAGRDVVHLHFDRPSVDFSTHHGTGTPESIRPVLRLPAMRTAFLIAAMVTGRLFWPPGSRNGRKAASFRLKN